jgi:hypothetical protein
VNAVKSIPLRRGEPGRIRRTVGWATLAVGGVFSGLMAVSLWWWAGYCGPTWLVDLGNGTLYVDDWSASSLRSTPLVGWSMDRNYLSDARWLVWGGQRAGSAWAREYSIWPAGPAMLVGGVACLWSARRAVRRRAGVCVRCQYSLLGISANVCPECGHAVENAERRS